jgi:hypothetical protein
MLDDKKREKLFLDMVHKYRVLFWTCLLGLVIFGGYAVFGHELLAVRGISAALAAACLYGAKVAPRGPWIRRSKGGFPGLGSQQDESVDPLAGDRSLDAAKAPATSEEESVSLSEAEDAEQTEGSAPPSE